MGDYTSRRNPGVCHVFQTDSGSKTAICGINPPIKGGLKLSEGLASHHPDDYCEQCGRLPCAKCDEGALKIAKKMNLPLPPWVQLSMSVRP